MDPLSSMMMLFPKAGHLPLQVKSSGPVGLTAMSAAGKTGHTDQPVTLKAAIRLVRSKTATPFSNKREALLP